MVYIYLIIYVAEHISFALYKLNRTIYFLMGTAGVNKHINSVICHHHLCKFAAEAGTRSCNATQPRPRPVAGGSASVSRQSRKCGYGGGSGSPISKISRPPWVVVSGWGGLLPITSPFSVSPDLFFSLPSPPPDH